MLVGMVKENKKRGPVGPSDEGNPRLVRDKGGSCLRKGAIMSLQIHFETTLRATVQ